MSTGVATASFVGRREAIAKKHRDPNADLRSTSGTLVVPNIGLGPTWNSVPNILRRTCLGVTF